MTMHDSSGVMHKSRVKKLVIYIIITCTKNYNCMTLLKGCNAKNKSGVQKLNILPGRCENISGI